MRELTPAQADDLYELISERVNKSVIITCQPSRNSPFEAFFRQVIPSPAVK